MATERWEIDSSHSSIHFSVRHLVIAKVRGQFSRWSGTVVVPDGDLTRATVEATIDAASIDTGVADRDTHLRSADFFDVAQFPDATFTSSRIEKAGDSLRLVGQLTLKGIAREVALEVEALGTMKDPWGNDRAAFSASTVIDRKDFGLGWNQVLETGGVVVGDKVTLEVEVQAVRQAASKVA
ncbi:MAG: YceI family protein [Vicinamibacterales bacterium]